jgi:hypothetical protein
MKPPGGVARVLIIAGPSAYWWEVTLIRGALSYCDIESLVVDHHQADAYGPEALRVLVAPCPPGAPVKVVEPASTRPTVLAGRQFTLEYLSGRIHPTPGEVLVYGEPYAFIPYLVDDVSRLETLRGRAVLGTLLDVRRYRTPAPLGADGPVPLMASIGCQKRCGYCSYGSTYARLYGHAFDRRSRPWRDLFQELTAFGRAGRQRFMLLADQLLSRAPAENGELRLLASRWRRLGGTRYSLAFTVAPPEALSNQPVLELLAAAFDIHPALSIDSLDDESLRRFGLSFSVADALDAARVLSDLGVAFRLNYLFIKPGMTLRALEAELNRLLELADIAGSLAPNAQVGLAHDIFSGRLRPTSGAPMWGEVDDENNAAYEQFLHPAVLAAVVSIQGVVGEAIERAAQGQGFSLRATVEAAIDEVASAA